MRTMHARLRDGWRYPALAAVFLTIVPAVALTDPAIGSAGAARGGVARLAVAKPAPLTVRGTGFRRHERVKVRLRGAGKAGTQMVRAGSRGRFRVVFPGVDVSGGCGRYRLSAAGALGSRATIIHHQHPNCLVS